MYEHPITANAGKKLKTQIKRRDYLEFKDPKEDELNEGGGEEDAHDAKDNVSNRSKQIREPLLSGRLEESHRSKDAKPKKNDENPRKGKPLLSFLYFLYKSLRIYFVIWAYYFMPISAIIYSFQTNKRQLV